MKRILQFATNDGGNLLIEINEEPVNIPTRSALNENNTRGLIQDAKENFDKALKPLKEVSNSIIECIKEISNSPNEIEVELGLKFTAHAGIILTSLDSEAHFRIVFKWKNEKGFGTT